MTRDRELWPTSRCAAYCGIATSTWRSYRRHIHMGVPAPVTALPGPNEDLYDAAEVRAWHANRPGQGARMDLRRS